MNEQIIKYESELAVGINSKTNELVTFSEAKHCLSELKETKNLTSSERKNLTLSRIEKAKNWPESVFFPGGVVDRNRALKEINDESDLSIHIIDTEIKVAEWVVGQLKKKETDNA